MCLAILKPKNKKIPKPRLKQAIAANSDGWGILYQMNNGLKEIKGIGDFDQFYHFYNIINRGQNIDLLIHFRTASSGQILENQCHPFFINKNLAFIQNGNIHQYGNSYENNQSNKRDNLSDVQRFNNQVLKQLPSGFLRHPDIRNALESYCADNFCKMVFMDSSGKIDIINEKSGEWIDGVWYSNGGIDNYIGYGYSGAYYYGPHDVRHKGGIPCVQMFPKDRRKHWKKCETCSGWFYHLENGICESCRIWKDLLKFTNENS